MRIAIVIPARLASTRFPAKPLAPLTGADGVAHPAIRYTWAAAQAAALLRKLAKEARAVGDLAARQQAQHRAHKAQRGVARGQQHQHTRAREALVRVLGHHDALGRGC